MATNWGVDSASAANSMVGSQTLFNYIKQQAGQAPAFWGRYVGGSYALSSSEANYIHQQWPAVILVIYNGATASSVSGGYQSGVNDANNAIQAAKNVGVAASVVIYADIEGSWSPTSDWFRGWSDTMVGSIFGAAGGVYMDTAVSSTNNAYCTAYNSDRNMQGNSDIFASEPEPGCTSAASKPGYGPYTPSCNSNLTVIWQYAENCYSGYVDEDEATGVGLQTMW